MDRDKDFHATRMKHFSKLHEKIQNKYTEMQRKIEQSKSIDSLTSIGEATDRLYRSTSDLSVDEVFVENMRHNDNKLHTAGVKDINVMEVSYADVGVRNASVSESESSTTTELSRSVNEADGKDEIQNVEDLMFNEWSLSIESLNELDKKHDEIISQPTSPKISFKNKIGSRILAAKERRREKKFLKNENKDILETARKVDKFIFSNTTKSDIRVKEKRNKIATATIALIDITGLDIDTSEDGQRSRTLQCRVRLGGEKCKSKNVKTESATSKAKWQEIFHLNLYDDINNELEISVWDLDNKDGHIGKAIVNLIELKKDKTHAMRITLQEGIMANAEIFFLLTITGTLYDDLLAGYDDYMVNRRRLEEDQNEFAFYHLKNFTKVGRLSVIIYGAKGLSASDCFCNVKLVNERRQTQTEYKTHEPNWMKIFTFDVLDVTSILYVVVTDEKKYEDIGRVAIPLLEIRDGSKVWYALKDDMFRDRAKGNNPRILLEMRLSWNIIKASIRTIKPKELDFLETDDKFDRKLLLKNIARAKVVVMWTMDFVKTLKSCFEWESKKWNTIWLIFWLLFNWNFSAWMAPLLLLIPFIWYRPRKYYLLQCTYNFITHKKEGMVVEKKEEKLTLRKKITNIQDLISSVQKFIGKFASFGESVKNLFNFSVPFLSFWSIFLIVAISLLIYIVPLNYILMGWGIKKYVRKIIWPNRVPHSEVMDLLSRVPDDEVLSACEKLPVESSSNQVEEDEGDESGSHLFEDLFHKEDNNITI